MKIERKGSLTLYRSTYPFFLPALNRPKIEVFRKRFDWIECVYFDYSPQGRCELCLGSAVESGESHAEEARVYARCAEIRLPRLGLQHMEYLYAHQREFRALFSKNIDRIWFRGMAVFEKGTCGMYYPVLFRERPHGRFTKWRSSWAHDFDGHTESDRIAFARR